MYRYDYSFHIVILCFHGNNILEESSLHLYLTSKNHQKGGEYFTESAFAVKESSKRGIFRGICLNRQDIIKGMGGTYILRLLSLSLRHHQKGEGILCHKAGGLLHLSLPLRNHQKGDYFTASVFAFRHYNTKEIFNSIFDLIRLLPLYRGMSWHQLQLVVRIIP